MSQEELQNLYLSTKSEIGYKLKSVREFKAITRYKMRENYNLRYEQIKTIDEGSHNYTIESLISYADSLGLKIEFVAK